MEKGATAMKSLKIQWKPLVISILISLVTGGISALLTSDSMKLYKSLNRPVLSPPPIAFPIVWTILYILMGVSAYMIFTSTADQKKKRNALFLYALQLVLNFLWPIIFFNLELYFFAFLWIVLLWVTVLLMIAEFMKIRPAAGFLQAPYLIWLTFAAYLSLAFYYLNK